MDIKQIGKSQNIPTAENLSLAEEKLGFTLSPSYKKFVKKYGSGLLCGFFNIFVPGSKVDLVNRSEEYKKTIKENIKMGLWKNVKGISEDWLLNLFPFGSTDNGDIMCWDISKKNDDGEYPIYLLDSEQEAAPLLAQSLNELIEEVCIRQKLDQIFPMGQGQSWSLPNTFEPY